MNSKGKRFATDILVYFLGYVAPKVISFILVPIYTAYLTKAEYGANDYIHTVLQALTPIISLQIPGTIMRFVIKDEQFSKKEVVSNGFLLVFAMGLLSTLATCAIYRIFDLQFPYFWLILAMGLTTVIYTMVAETARGLDFTKLYAAVGALNTLLYASLSILFIVVLHTSYDGLLWAATLANVISIFVLIIATKMYHYFSAKQINKSCTKGLMKYALPLIPNAVSWWALSMSDRIVIKGFLGLDDNGIYAVSSKLASIISICYHAFDKAWLVNAIKEFDSPDKESFYSSLFDKLMSFMMIVCAGLLCINRVFMKIWVDAAFYEAWMYSIPLILSTAFYCFAQFYGVAYNCSKKTQHALYSTLLAAAVNLGISLLLVKSIGLYAMAYATLIAYIVLFIVRKKNTASYFPVRVNMKRMVIQCAALAAIAALNYIDLFYVSLPIQILLVGFVLWMNRHLIKEILQMLKKGTVRK